MFHSIFLSGEGKHIPFCVKTAVFFIITGMGEDCKAFFVQKGKAGSVPRLSHSLFMDFEAVEKFRGFCRAVVDNLAFAYIQIGDGIHIFF